MEMQVDSGLRRVLGSPLAQHDVVCRETGVGLGPSIRAHEPGERLRWVMFLKRHCPAQGPLFLAGCAVSRLKGCAIFFQSCLHLNLRQGDLPLGFQVRKRLAKLLFSLLALLQRLVGRCYRLAIIGLGFLLETGDRPFERAHFVVVRRDSSSVIIFHRSYSIAA
ncbi:hypothetical protein [Microbulbifer magnicolonia]|uniref:hypothetical protein n=1 Tax=Microbulbifer magnicolonia TaxID=3109744 RepID=UPI002B400680|nr:hypothetical protein [Microbulbifer sp. GG15]